MKPRGKASDVGHLEAQLAELAAKAPAGGLLAAVSALKSSIKGESFFAAVRKAMNRAPRPGARTVLTPSQAARAIGTTTEGLDRLVRLGMVLTVFIGRRRMFPRSEINRLLADADQAGDDAIANVIISPGMRKLAKEKGAPVPLPPRSA